MNEDHLNSARPSFPPPSVPRDNSVLMYTRVDFFFWTMHRIDPTSIPSRFLLCSVGSGGRQSPTDGVEGFVSTKKRKNMRYPRIQPLAFLPFPLEHLAKTFKLRDGTINWAESYLEATWHQWVRTFQRQTHTFSDLTKSRVEKKKMLHLIPVTCHLQGQQYPSIKNILFEQPFGHLTGHFCRHTLQGSAFSPSLTTRSHE